jgi:hypothetical protein
MRLFLRSAMLWTIITVVTALLFWTLGREYAWILGQGTPFWGWGAPGPQRGMMSISWVRTGEERRHSKMTENKEDGSITASRNDYAQSKCHCASGNNSVTYPLRELCSIVLLFQENKSFGASYHMHSSSDVKPCREHLCHECQLKIIRPQVLIRIPQEKDLCSSCRHYFMALFLPLTFSFNFIPEFSVTGLFWSAASVMYLWHKFQNLFATAYLKIVICRLGQKIRTRWVKRNFV